MLSVIGAGGMGEVYRARDTRLGREVAVKVLPAGLARDQGLRSRFEREARAVSALNHPHIAALFDVGREVIDGQDVHFLVMELIEGESLADRLARGPLPLKEVLSVGAQVAAGLDAAHRRGIVHRDLKPGNVMLSPSGAKLLDFGLAADAASRDPSDLSALSTRAKPLTEAGTILGTVQYMAPEQLEGRSVDPRTDVFALGAVLHEMATGRKAFEGASRASVIAPGFSAGAPRPLFHARVAATRQMAHYRLHPDGRILTLAPGDTSAVRDAVMVLNWPTLLRN